MFGLIRNKQKRKQLLGGMGLMAAVGAGMASYAALHEPMNIRLDHLSMHVPTAKGRIPQKGLRILHISDTHFQGIEWRERAKMARILQLVAGLEYDLLVHTGDFWHNDSGLSNVVSLLRSLPKPRLGAFGVLGNHDYTCYSHSDVLTRNWEQFQAQGNGIAPQSNGQGYRHLNGTLAGAADTAVQEQVTKKSGLLTFAQECVQFLRYFLNAPFELERVSFNNTLGLTQELERQGVEVMTNRSLHLRHNPGEPDGVDMYIAGVDDVAEGQPDLRTAFDGIPQDAFTLLLSHNPDILDEEGYDQASVVLCGHTHGGQIVIPLLGPIHTHSHHLRRPEVAGYLRRNDTQIYVSRGIGEGVPLRFGAQPQITLITLTA